METITPLKKKKSTFVEGKNVTCKIEDALKQRKQALQVIYLSNIDNFENEISEDSDFDIQYSSDQDSQSQLSVKVIPAPDKEILVKKASAPDDLITDTDLDILVKKQPAIESRNESSVVLIDIKDEINKIREKQESQKDEILGVRREIRELKELLM